MADLKAQLDEKKSEVLKYKKILQGRQLSQKKQAMILRGIIEEIHFLCR